MDEVIVKGYIEENENETYSFNRQAAPLMALASTPIEYKIPEYTPVSNQGNIGSCHDDKTEVLTNNGWILFKELTGKELLGSVDPKTNKLIFEKPTKLFDLPFNDKVIIIKKRTIDLKITPNHKMLVRKWNQKNRKLQDNFELIEAKDMGWYCGLMNRVVWRGSVKSSDDIILPGVEHKHKSQRIDRKVNMKSYLKFLGLYLAEGCFLKSYSNKKRYAIQIAAVKDREREFAEQVFKELGVHASSYKDRYIIHNKQLFTALQLLDLQGVKSYNKFVPGFVFDQSSDNIKCFLLGHFMGDGSVSNDHKSHYTSSKQLADDLQRLVFLSGNESFISERPPRKSIMKDGRIIVGKYPEYRVSVCKKKNLSIERKKDISYENYNGRVYCAEVPTYHTLITRRNGKILISGNCVANATCDAFEILKGLEDPNSVEQLSRLFVYWNSRKYHNDTKKDSGTYISKAMKSLIKYGICRESTWKYKTNKVFDQPNILAYKEADDNEMKAGSYYKIKSTGNNRLDDIEAAVKSNHPVVFGVAVGKAFTKYRGGDKVWNYPNDSVGGHAMVCCGIRGAGDNREFWIRNSWGNSWGINGHCWFSANYMKRANELYVPTRMKDLLV